MDTGNDGGADNLHLVTDGFYGGHPNPTRAAGAAAGLYEDSANGAELTGGDLPADWNTITGGNTNPEEGVYAGGASDGSLHTIGSSSNGLTEYTASGISDDPNAEVLAVASFNGNITFLEIVSDGTQGGTSTSDTQTVNVGQTPLDVWAVGNGGIDGFGTGAGAVFVARFGGDDIVVLEPGTPPVPTDDFDGDLILDKNDPLQYDPDNGTTLVLADGQRILFTLNPADPDAPGPDGPWNIGFNGWMVDGVTELNPDLPGVTEGLGRSRQHNPRRRPRRIPDKGGRRRRSHRRHQRLARRDAGRIPGWRGRRPL